VKHKAGRIAPAPCPNGPDGAHYWVMSWPESGRYIGTCRYCNEVRDADPALGLGGKPCGIVLEGSCSNREYPLQADFVEAE
jgi:hypothetical protein